MELPDGYTALELVPLCSAKILVSGTHTLEGTPQGNLMIGEIGDSIWEGERFSARQKGAAAADWLNVTPDGTAHVDVRLTLETADGGLVFVEYTGRTDLETGYAYSCPTFRTGVPDLLWLNRIQTVAKGIFDPGEMSVTYPEIYELR